MIDSVAMNPLAELRSAVESSAAELAEGAVPDGISLEAPSRPEHGDYSTNAAMLLAPLRGEPPRGVADSIVESLSARLGERADRIEVAGPGFINLHLSDRWFRESVAAILASPGLAPSTETPERVLVEFVSANPTGPLTVASGRGAAFGDTVARLLEIQGDPVEREYLLNDVGTQVRLLGESIRARMRGEEVPEGGYEGDYVRELADELAASADNVDPDRLARLGVDAMRTRIEATLDRFGVNFDTWFSERTLHEAGKIEAAVDELRERGHVYDRDGAVWLRTTEFGDDKDRVLIRGDGEPTYFGADVAYHRDKLERGAKRMIDPLGADHHGYVPRMRAAFAALGVDPDRYEAPIMQLMNVVEGGERAQMSKRRGDFVTLDELMDDIGVDAARWFLVQRSHDTPLDLDLDLARKSSQDNPVYYVQYAHARVASILRRALAEGALAARENEVPDEAAAIEPAAAEAALEMAAEASERALVRRLLQLPGEVSEAAQRRAPHRLCAYATATAADFHAFYRDCQVVGAGEGLEAARLGLSVATKNVLAQTLGLLGVQAPERM